MTHEVRGPNGCLGGVDMRGKLTTKPRRNRGSAPERRRPPSLATARMTVSLATALALGGLTSACIDRNTVHLVPAIHGHVVDALTGKPIQGMQVARWFERQSGFGPGGSDDARVDDSFITATTDADGRFEFLRWRGFVRGIDRLEWFAYKPGYMPAKGWYRHIGADPNRPQHATIPWPDPWVDAKFVGVSNGLVMELKVFPPTLDGVAFQTFDGSLGKLVPSAPQPAEQDPWAEYFHRLNVGTRDSLLPAEEFVKEAVAYLEKHEVTEAMLPPLAELTDRINSHLEPDLARARCTILRSIVRYCRSSSQSKWCALPIIGLSLRNYREDCHSPEEP